MIGYQSATIASGASLSGAANMDGRALVGIIMPATWTAANLTFQGSADGTTYNNFYDVFGTEVNINAAASRFIQVSPVDFAGPQYLKVRSGTSGTAVNQAADRTLILVFREV